MFYTPHYTHGQQGPTNQPSPHECSSQLAAVGMAPEGSPISPYRWSPCITPKTVSCVSSAALYYASYRTDIHYFVSPVVPSTLQSAGVIKRDPGFSYFYVVGYQDATLNRDEGIRNTSEQLRYPRVPPRTNLRFC